MFKIDFDFSNGVMTNGKSNGFKNMFMQEQMERAEAVKRTADEEAEEFYDILQQELDNY